MTGETASIIIPCHNQLKYTVQCLRSILLNTGIEYEIIIIENASTDGTFDWLNKFKKKYQCKIIKNKFNIGAPKAFNQGTEKASFSNIIFLNNDILVSKGWAAKLIDKMSKTRRAGIAGPSVINYSALSSSQEPEEKKIVKEFRRLAAFVEMKRKNKYLKVAGLTSCCMLAKRDMIKHIGGFDENYGLGTNDDHDFCLRARLASYDIICALDTLILHYCSKTLGRIDMALLDRENREYFIKKFKEAGVQYFREIGQPYGLRGENTVLK